MRAFPAVELLWRRADRVEARVRSYDADGIDLADELAQTRGIGELDVRIGRVRATAGVTLDDVRLRKRDGVLSGRAVLDGDELSRALPPRVELALVPRRDGAIMLAGRIGGAEVQLRVVARDGRVIARPEGLLGVFAGYPVFSDPRIDVEQVAAVPLPGGRFALSARARLT
ncbi:hypothetical protein Cwoe_5270 [Conexibacter woesei DSM 14684]|uniref:DUF2993 domain-containing protein n=1 Tax=Conexibacter woesei (strain DSM 14684 / CCUG 47730 / CIP 108061 / JCM 11494 / NBRC 100937 / ID131577) TaxID=469383 RepID=D3FEI4_CONWI|nr:hypothetical protein Cwoe_5270 [Conexibacter woesei DSM 14684]